MHGFYLRMPASVMPNILSATGPTSQWVADVAVWSDIGFLDWNVSPPEAGISQGATGSFTLVTKPSVPTGYSYAPAPFGPANWDWTDTSLDDTRRGWATGDTVLPVPVPEPASLLALSAGLVSAGALLRRRRR